MAALNGIGTLQAVPSSLNVGNTSAVTSAQSKLRAAGGAETLPAQAGTVDRASLSAAGGLAAQGPHDSDVRLGRVAELRTAIENGTYNVSASAVADKIIEGLLEPR